MEQLFNHIQTLCARCEANFTLSFDGAAPCWKLTIVEKHGSRHQYNGPLESVLSGAMGLITGMQSRGDSVYAPLNVKK